jgi:hypothetical protein
LTQIICPHLQSSRLTKILFFPPNSWRLSEFASKAKACSSQVLLVRPPAISDQHGSDYYLGTGKSVCLRAIIERLRTRYDRESVFVTASTGNTFQACRLYSSNFEPLGIAAINVGGSTLHSFAGGAYTSRLMVTHGYVQELALASCLLISYIGRSWGHWIRTERSDEINPRQRSAGATHASWLSTKVRCSSSI